MNWILALKIIFHSCSPIKSFILFLNLVHGIPDSQKKIRWIFLHFNELSALCIEAKVPSMVVNWWHCIKSSPHVSGPELQWTLEIELLPHQKISRWKGIVPWLFQKKGEKQKHLSNLHAWKNIPWKCSDIWVQWVHYF